MDTASEPCTPEYSERVCQEWHNRVVAEYRSAALTAEVLHGLIAVGADERLIAACQRIVSDELLHSRLSAECLEAYRQGYEPPPVELGSMATPVLPQGLFATLVVRVVRNFCLGETFAVPLFAAMRAHTTEPMARAALDQILKDEAMHRAFGWDVLDELIALDPQVREMVAGLLPGWIEEFRASYGTLRAVPLLSEGEKACGLLDIPEYVRIYQEALEHDILPRFARRNIIPAPSPYASI